LCGIAGFFRKNPTATFDPDKLEAMFVSLQLRGTDAAGWAWGMHDKAAICKSKGSATKVLTMPKAPMLFRAAARAPWALYHCRAATNGTKNDNKNNHPIFTDKTVLVHNGIVHAKRDVDTLGECDSELIGRLIDEEGPSKAFQQLTGTIATAYNLLNDPNSIYLYRETNPIFIAEDDDYFVFASTSACLEKLGYKKTEFLDTYTIFKITSAGKEVVEKFQVVNTTYPTGNYETGYGQFGHQYQPNRYQHGINWDDESGDLAEEARLRRARIDTHLGVTFPPHCTIIHQGKYKYYSVAMVDSVLRTELHAENNVEYKGKSQKSGSELLTDDGKLILLDRENSLYYIVKETPTALITTPTGAP